MKKTLSILLLLVGLLCGLQAQQMHRVGKKETLWSLSRQYGLTVDELVDANPEMRSSDYKLKKGSMVLIPAPRSAAVPSETPKAGMECLNVAVLLPLEASGSEGDRSIEFYRGLLMAAKVAARASEKEINVICCNEPPAAAPMGETLAGLNGKNLHLIVGPVYPSHFSALSDFVRGQRMRLVVPFSSKVEEVKNNENIILLNTPDGYEWLYASRLLMQRFEGVERVVRIRTTEGKLRACADYLAQRFSERGVTVREVGPELRDAELLAAAAPSGRTLLLPDCAGRAALENLLGALRRFRQSAAGRTTTLLGFPAWIDHLAPCGAELAAQDAYIFSAYHYDAGSAATTDFVHRYKTLCRADLLPVNPRMALLGYDTGRALFTLWLQKGFDAPLSSPPTVEMLQSEPVFGRISGGGYINKGTFLLHVEPGGRLVRVAVNR